MRLGRISLRASFAIMVIVLGALTSAAGASLILITTYLHRTTVSLEENVESVRIAHELAAALLTHSVTRDEIPRAALEADARRLLAQARRHATNPTERALVEDASREVTAYFKAQTPDGVAARPPVGTVFGTLQELIRFNVAKAQDAMLVSERWDDAGDVIGIGVAGLVIVTAALLLWLQARALRPVLAIQAALQRFGAGDRSCRAPEDAPQELRDIAVQFNAMAETVERQHADQLAFLAGVAHDLRNPLMALKMSCAIVSPERPLPPEGRVREVFSRVQRQIDRLDRMAWDLLDASRLEAGAIDLALRDHDVREIASTALDLFEPMAKVHHLQLTIPEHAVMVRCDPDRLTQVMNNLVSNAIKYSPRGGTVRVSVAGAGEEAILSVADEGVGIPPEDLPRIFEPFHRSGASTEAVPGVGLGLFIARRIVEAHGGRIEVESKVGEGSTFRVHLPLAGAPQWQTS